MPFQTKRLDRLPQDPRGPLEPDIQIFFHGQLILRSDGQESLVAVNPLATDHILSIETRIKKYGKRDRISMRHLGPLNERDSEGMLLEVSGDTPVVPAAFKLVGRDEIDHANPDSAAEDDFRWILNAEGPMFHGAELNVPIFASHNVIRLRGGEFYFKTAARANPRYQYRRSGGNKPDQVVAAIGAIASASVFLSNEQTLVMKWKDATRDRTHVLEKSANTSYEIYIENTPLYLDPPREHELPLMDEFKEYYKVLGIPEGPDRFSFVPELRRSGDLGTPDVPCQVITLDGPGGGA